MTFSQSLEYHSNFAVEFKKKVYFCVSYKNEKYKKRFVIVNVDKNRDVMIFCKKGDYPMPQFQFIDHAFEKDYQFYSEVDAYKIKDGFFRRHYPNLAY